MLHNWSITCISTSSKTDSRLASSIDCQPLHPFVFRIRLLPKADAGCILPGNVAAGNADELENEDLWQSTAPEPSMQHRLVGRHESAPTLMIVCRAEGTDQTARRIFLRNYTLHFAFCVNHSRTSSCERIQKKSVILNRNYFETVRA